tara:strand:- start:2918 stop:3187 length:270 start_codon:yes stop_codon:yes gene_type:complete
MFSCPLCRYETIFLSKLCDKCDRIRHIISIYSIDKVLEVIEEKLVVKNEEFNIKIGENIPPILQVSDVEIKPLKTIQINTKYQLRSNDS